MSSLLDCPVRNAIFLYLFIVICLLTTKPTSLFTHDGKIRPFGVERTSTLFSFPVVLFIASIIITFFFESIAR